MKKVVLITGASSGIGNETARLMIQKGFIVYGAARRIDRMQDLKTFGVRLLQMDVTDDDSMVKGIQKIINTESRIDVLVNNAVMFLWRSGRCADRRSQVPVWSECLRIGPVDPAGTSIFEKSTFRENYQYLFNCRKIGEPHGSWYHATKFAVEGLSDSLRMELKQFGIKVVIIQPGAIIKNGIQLPGKI